MKQYDLILRRLMITGFRRGMTGHQAWLVLGISAITLRTLRKLANAEPIVLFRTELHGGDRFEITTERV